MRTASTSSPARPDLARDAGDVAPAVAEELGVAGRVRWIDVWERGLGRRGQPSVAQTSTQSPAADTSAPRNSHFVPRTSIAARSTAHVSSRGGRDTACVLTSFLQNAKYLR